MHLTMKQILVVALWCGIATTAYGQPWPCESSPCLNNATCVNKGDRGYSCICLQGFKGKHCDELDRICKDVNDTCERQAMLNECATYPGTMERDCRSSCHFCGVCLIVECSVNRVCVLNSSAVQGYSCECPEGKTGKHCDESLCDPECQNGGVCKEDTLTCKCPPGFDGSTCEICVDEYPQCAEWAAAGECEDNARHMMAFCRVSCHNCPDKPCTKKGEFCVDGASCINDRKCQCDDGTVGDGRIYCAHKEDNVCILAGRSYLQSYGNAGARLNFPCRYRLSRFVTELHEGGFGARGKQNEASSIVGEVGAKGDTQAYKPIQYCAFEVFGFSLVSEEGNYYPGAVEVSLALVDLVNQKFVHRDFVKFDVGLGGIASSHGHSIVWGEDYSESWLNVTIDCVFTKDNFAVLSVPQCGRFHLKFRSYDQEAEDLDLPQTRPPAIVVSAAPGAKFDHQHTRFPGSLCGEHEDDSLLYDKGAQILGLNDADEVLLYSGLRQNLPQRSIINGLKEVVLQDADNCEEANAIFSICGNGNETIRAEALKACHGLLSQKYLLRCLGPLAMEAFNSCLDVFCNERIQSCKIIREDFRKARPLTRTRCRFPGFLRKLCKNMFVEG